MTEFGLAAALLASVIAPGVYSNEEQVYFERDAGRTPPPRLTVRVESDAARVVDAFGTPLDQPPPKLVVAADGALTAQLADGRSTELRRARPATCWAATLKDARKADGSEDWHFKRGLKLHDQGGRARVEAAGAKPVVLRMRNVVWPSGPNRPSLVLYIHSPDDPERSVAYSWADPGAVRIGVNLRWMQASCTIDGTEDQTTPRRDTQ